jgi:hypothetical protein
MASTSKLPLTCWICGMAVSLEFLHDRRTWDGSARALLCREDCVESNSIVAADQATAKTTP